MHIHRVGPWLAITIVAPVIAVQVIAVNVAIAQNRAPAPNKCQPAVHARHTITHQTGPSSFSLDNGSEVVLAGLVIATRHDGNTVVSSWPPERKARQEIERLTVGTSAAIAQTSSRKDRYGRLRAHLFLDQAGQTKWLQALLLRQGHARLNPEELTIACTDLLLNEEAKARSARIGLWQHAAYQIRHAKRPRELLRYRHSFQIVEGVVRRVSRRGAQAYVNFGKSWRTDFTAGISATLAREAKIKGVPLSGLAGHTVRIRGWIRQRSGPYIAIRSLSQIQLLRRSEAIDRFRQRQHSMPLRLPQTRKRPADKQPGAAIDL